jgi:hypothetical protein
VYHVLPKMYQESWVNAMFQLRELTAAAPRPIIPPTLQRTA